MKTRSPKDKTPDKPPKNAHMKGWSLSPWHKRGHPGVGVEALRLGHKKRPVHG